MSRKKHFFNMVEVALALLVISLGLATVLTLFPAGLKATREAENANNVVEAAEYIFAYLQTKVSEDGLEKIDTTNAATDNYPSLSNANRIEEIIIKPENSPEKIIGLVYHKSIKMAGENAYLEDFSCVARILDAKKGMKSDADAAQSTYTSSEVIAVPLAEKNKDDKNVEKSGYYFQLAKVDESVSWAADEISSTGGTAESKNKSDKVSDVIKVVNVELSYPASVAYENREKRIFRMVFLSGDYEPHP